MTLAEIMSMPSLNPKKMPNIQPLADVPPGHVVGALGTYSEAHPTHKSVAQHLELDREVVRGPTFPPPNSPTPQLSAPKPPAAARRVGSPPH